MADEIYRAQIVFDINDTDAIREAERTAQRIMEEIRRISRERIRIPPPNLSDFNRGARSIDAIFDKMQKRAEKFGRTKVSPVLDLKDELTQRAEKAQSLLREIGRTKVGPLMEIKGDILRELRVVRSQLREIERLHPTPTITLRDRISARLSGIRAQLVSISNLASRVTVGTAGGINNVSGRIMGAAPGILGTATVLGAAGTLGPLKLAADKENTLLSTEFFTGSKEKGQDAYNRIIDFAATTPFGVEYSKRTAVGLMGTYKAMQGKNFDSEEMLNDTFRTMRAFGDAAGLTGAGENGSDLALYGFRQIATIGKLNMEEMRQVTENLMVPMSAFREELGLTEEQMKSLGDQNIPAAKAMEAIVRTLEKNYGGGMEKLSNTLAGMTSQLMDTGRLAVTSFGDGMAVPIRRILKDLLQDTDYTKQGFKNFADMLEQVGGGVGKFFEESYENVRGYFSKLMDDPTFANADMGGKISRVLHDLVDKGNEFVETTVIPQASKWGAAIFRGITSNLLTGDDSMADSQGRSFGEKLGAAVGSAATEAITGNPLTALLLGAYVASAVPGPIQLKAVLGLAIALGPYEKAIMDFIVNGFKSVSISLNLGHGGSMGDNPYMDSDPNNNPDLGPTVLTTPSERPWYSKALDSVQDGFRTVQKAVRGYASGGIVTRPHVGMVGEAGPEAIIPLSSSRRSRGLDLYRRAGAMLGVRPYADGGIVGSYSMAGGAAASSGGAGSISVNVGDVNLNAGGSIQEIAAAVGQMVAQKILEAYENTNDE